MSQPNAFEQSSQQALDQSAFAGFPDRAREQLLSNAIRLDIPAGTVPYREGDTPRVGLVIAGLVRVYMTSQEGRQITIRYARPGDLLGITAMVGGPVPTSVQALTDSSLVMLNPSILESLAKSDPNIGWAVAQEVARRLISVLPMITGAAFGSIRERTAVHLLELAAQRQHDRILIAPVTQQEVADAVGSVREVVARALQRLQQEKLIKNTREGIVILDPAGLLASASSTEL